MTCPPLLSPALPRPALPCPRLCRYSMLYFSLQSLVPPNPSDSEALFLCGK